MLMALNRPLPETIFAHGWWTVDGEKMSKSRGNVVDPNKMVETYGVDAFRYFLLREVPFGQDGDFSEQRMARRINSDLANGIGNLLSRTLTMIDRSCNGTIPKVNHGYIEIEKEGYKSLKFAKDQLLGLTRTGELDGSFNRLEFNNLLLLITSGVTNVDIAIDKHEPWRLAKDPDKRVELNEVLYTAAECLRILSLIIYPFMPGTAKNISDQLGLDLDFNSPLLIRDIKWGDLQSGTKIRKGTVLFPRIESKPGAKPVTESSVPSQPTPPAPAPTAAPTPPATLQITIDDFMKIQLKTAKVISAERVPKSEKLLKLQVSLGTEQRQIVAGIGKKYEPDTLVGKTIVVANLKPAKLMGIESQGMVLAAGDADVRGLLTIQEEVDPGTKVK
jgi:methionyl-tRNA synthetase